MALLPPLWGSGLANPALFGLGVESRPHRDSGYLIQAARTQCLHYIVTDAQFNHGALESSTFPASP